MSQHKILLVLDEHDKHHELVVQHLDSTPIIFDPANISEGIGLSYFQEGKHQYMIIGDVVLDNVRAIWWRKMLELSTVKMPMKELEQAYGDPSFADYASRSVRRHANALGAFYGNALWVSNPYNMSQADNKAWQLRVAYSVGMAVPHTLQTSSAEHATQFVKQLGGICIVKSLSNHFPVTPEKEELMFWSQRILPGQKISYEGLDVAPAIFQQAIEGYDVRVTVVGDKVFAAKIAIDEDKTSAIRDWRIVGQGVAGNPTIEPYRLPAKLAGQCIRMLKKLNLSYGAFDFVVDREDIHWFLEVNPMGAWGFIEEDTGLPIGKAMAELLINS